MLAEEFEARRTTREWCERQYSRLVREHMDRAYAWESLPPGTFNGHLAEFTEEFRRTLGAFPPLEIARVVLGWLFQKEGEIPRGTRQTPNPTHQDFLRLIEETFRRVIRMEAQWAEPEGTA